MGSYFWSDLWSIAKPVVVFLIVLVIGVTTATWVAMQAPEEWQQLVGFLLGMPVGIIAMMAAMISAE